jgi:hypothetical protein
MKTTTMIYTILLLFIIGCSSPTTQIVEEEHTHEDEVESHSHEDFIIQENIATTYFLDNVETTFDAEYVHVISNGLPDHETGEFPSKGNPNTISEQNYEFSIPLTPIKTEVMTTVKEPGYAINGVKMDPGTAERWGCNIPCDPTNVDSSLPVWSIEAIQEEMDLGLDYSNAHVQPTGAYHYHGIPVGLLDEKISYQLVGWAMDGFPMYVDTSYELTSGYALKEGERLDGPLGEYDGTYTQDYEYVGGDLDQCNGAEIVTSEFAQGTYAYILTDTFPFIPRCLYGEVEGQNGPGGIPSGDRGERPEGEEGERPPRQ